MTTQQVLDYHKKIRLRIHYNWLLTKNSDMTQCDADESLSKNICPLQLNRALSQGILQSHRVSIVEPISTPDCAQHERTILNYA